MATENPTALPGTDPKLFARFMAKVKITDGCWLWQAGTNPNGYGKFRLPTSHVAAHRIAYTIFCGPIPVRAFVCHVCDVRLCVAPHHLFVGDQSSNMADMVAKGRSPRGDLNSSRVHPERLARGTLNPNAKLTDAAVREIRRLHATGWVQTALAREYGVAHSAIGAVLRRETWRHVV